MFDRPQSAGTKLIWLVNWMWRDSSVIPGGQQEGVLKNETNLNTYNSALKIDMLTNDVPLDR